MPTRYNADLAAIASEAIDQLTIRHRAREVALAVSREVIRFSANAIRAVHRGEFEDARELIREQIGRAAAKAGEIAPMTLEGRVVMEVQREEPWPAHVNPDAERTDAFTLRYSGEHIWQVFGMAFYGKRDLPVPS